MKQAAKAQSAVQLATLVAFTFMMVVTVYSPRIPVGCLKIHFDGEYELTSIAITAVIIILYNLISWSQLHQKILHSQQITDLSLQKERVLVLCENLEFASKACSTFDNNIDANYMGEEEPEEEKELKREHNKKSVSKILLGDTIKLFDKENYE